MKALLLKAVEALKVSRHSLYNGSFPLGWNIDRIDAELADLEAAIREQPGEVVAWQWRRKGEAWTLQKTFNFEVYATTADSEVRPLYAVAPLKDEGEARQQLSVPRDLLLRAAALLSERAPCADPECQVADDGAAMKCYDDLCSVLSGKAQP